MARRRVATGCQRVRATTSSGSDAPPTSTCSLISGATGAAGARSTEVGPGIATGERIYGASLLDIAPTVLLLLGLPAAEDMDGKPLLGAIDRPLLPRQIPEPTISYAYFIQSVETRVGPQRHRFSISQSIASLPRAIDSLSRPPIIPN